jgi:RNA polymerase sigma-70 factor (ECF subfamily)
MDWELLYREHSPKVYNYLMTLTGDVHQAEDLLQETFIKAMRSQDRLKNRDKVCSWLYSISRNLFLDARRKDVRRKTDAVAEFSETEMDLTTRHPNPEEHTIRRDFMNRLNLVLNNLDESYRTAFILGVVHKMPYREIVEVTGWSLVTVKSKIFRARRKVAAALTDLQG